MVLATLSAACNTGATLTSVRMTIYLMTYTILNMYNNSRYIRSPHICEVLEYPVIVSEKISRVLEKSHVRIPKKMKTRDKKTNKCQTNTGNTILSMSVPPGSAQRMSGKGRHDVRRRTPCQEKGTRPVHLGQRTSTFVKGLTDRDYETSVSEIISGCQIPLGKYVHGRHSHKGGW